MRTLTTVQQALVIGKYVFIGVLLPSIIGVILYFNFNSWTFVHEAFHAFIEAFGSVIAMILLGLIYINRHDLKLDSTDTLCIASGLATMGLLDLFHAIVPVGNNFVWLHSVATFVGGLCFSLIWLKKYSVLSNIKLPFICSFLALILGFISIYFEPYIPSMLNQGQFSILASFLNIAGGIGFLLACTYFFKRHVSDPSSDNILLAVHCLLFGVAGLIFRLSSLWDAAWWWWHVCRFIAYSVLFFAFAIHLKKQLATIPKHLKQNRFLIQTLVVMLIFNMAFIFSNLSTIHENQKLMLLDAKYLQPLNLNAHLLEKHNQLLYVYIICMVLLSAFFYVMYFRNTLKRIEVEKELQQSKSELENTAISRTIQLTHKQQLNQLLYTLSLKAYHIKEENELLEFVIRKVAQFANCNLGHVYITDAAQQILKPTNLWYQNYDGDHSLKHLTRERTFKKGEGLIGKIMEEGKPLWIVNIEDSQLFTRKCNDPQHPIHSVFAFPVRYQKQIYAVFEFYYFKAQSLPAVFYEAVEYIGTQLDQIIDGIKAKQKLTNYTHELEQNNKLLIEAKQNAEHANQVKSEFLAMMSHEIRTPITAMLGFTEMIQQHQACLAYPEIYDLSKRVITSSDHLLSLINDILDFSKIESGQLRMEDRLFNTQDLFKAIDVLFENSTQEKDISLAFEHIKTLPLEIKSDEVRIKQVIVNLLSNAVKFTPNGGSVSCQADFNFNTKCLTIIVKDNGIGISKDQIDNIFQPFSQEDSSTTRRFGGTGLGLSISRSICHKLQGDLVCQSEPKKGSSFTATFIVSNYNTDAKYSTTSPDDIPENQDEIDFRRVRILVAEDVADNQEIIKFHLDRIGVQYDIVNNGAEAVEQALANDYDLILMDIRMPVLDGVEATTTLLQCGFTAPIIALTANTLKEDIDQYHQIGFRDVIGKPFRSNALASVLKKHLHSIQVPLYKDEDNFENQKEYIEMQDNFFARLPQDIENLRTLFQTNQFSNLKIQIHNIKSMLRLFSAQALADTAQEIESHLDANDGPLPETLITEFFKDLKTLYEEYQPILQKDAHHGA